MRKKGFTLIELLVVIGIIGILAAGILAAIDPLEQLKKGRDSTKRSVCIETFNALTRYYANKGKFPWGRGSSYGPSSLGSSTAVISTLMTIGELKTEFMQGLAAGADTMISIYGATTDTIMVCFNPESKGISDDPSTIFTSNQGGTSAVCAPTASKVTATCYWCAK